MAENADRSIITLQEYIDKGKIFEIPCYQRGYVWGKSRSAKNKEEDDSVSYMMKSLLDGYKNNSQIFIQGVTVTENVDSIVLIDGQQRTTFFYLLLLYLRYTEYMELEYKVRTVSTKFLRDLKLCKDRDDLLAKCGLNSSESYQDIYYFKKTVRDIDGFLNKMEQSRLLSFKEYVLKRVCFLYIDIPDPKKAVSVFKMMNGNRAEMMCEDVIKAEMLRLVSLDEENDSDAAKREQDMLRSRYAREWDKWSYWWNRGEIRSFYRLGEQEHPLNVLLTTFYKDSSGAPFNFENFRTRFLRDRGVTKVTFASLRRLQKSFEDTYNDVDRDSHRHNTVGAVLCALDRIGSAHDFLADYFGGQIKSLEQFYRLCMMSAGKGDGWLNYGNLKRISNALADNSLDEDGCRLYDEAKAHFMNVVLSPDLYHNAIDGSGYKEFAFRQLMHLNVERDNALERAFNFAINWDRSIEHIFAKSKVYALNEENVPYCVESGKLLDMSVEQLKEENYIFEGDFHEGYSEHCIGNFALLYFYNNTQFSNKPFKEKKKILFDYDNEVDVFSSRELLHTMNLFSNDEWGIEEIEKNRDIVVEQLKKYYYGEQDI